MTDRPVALRVLAALQQTPVGDAAVFVDSSGLFGFDTRVPALTEDIDVAVPEQLVAQHGRAIVEALARQGFAHEAGTAPSSARRVRSSTCSATVSRASGIISAAAARCA